MDIREKILNASDIKEELEEIEEWGVTVLLRGLTGKERARLLNESAKVDGSVNLEKMYPDLVIMGARDPETKQPIFSPADREVLNEKAGGVLEHLAQRVMELSAITKKARDAAEKNSSSTPSEEPTSSSPNA